jgi:hypothetical protein
LRNLRVIAAQPNSNLLAGAESGSIFRAADRDAHDFVTRAAGATRTG